MIPQAVAKYFRTRGAAGDWEIRGAMRRDFLGAVVIPALAEEESLPATLAALAANPAEIRDRFLALVVVNNRADAPELWRRQNQRTLASLRRSPPVWPGLNLGWVDAASPGRELPPGEGVGLARKIGFDLALARLDWHGEPLFVSLDADTLVRPDYLAALVAHFQGEVPGGAVIPFRHHPGATPAQNEAITRYELYLRHYVLGLELAGSPYAYHTVGSAFACRARAYVAAGGMNRRRAGEDFYFLQQLAKTSGVSRVRGTLVHPSPRVSTRTPFGTGPAVAQLLAGEARSVRFYHLRAFELLRRFLRLMAAAENDSGEHLLAPAGTISPILFGFLQQFAFTAAWDNLRRQHRGGTRLQRAFHQWFDGLRTRRLLYQICESEGLWATPQRNLPPLLTAAGLKSDGNIGTYLAALREYQMGEALASQTG